MSINNLNYYRPTKKSDQPKVIEKDLIIYGSAPAAITAAVQAQSMGFTVAILEFGKHIGGMTVGGLTATDIGYSEAVGGLSKKFYKEIATHYHTKKETFLFEPKVAEKIFLKWIEQSNIPVYYNQHLKEVVKKEKVITEIIMEDGNRYKGKMFIDCTYEGDLYAKAGVSFTVGREANAVYKEIYNGIQFGAPYHKFEKWIDPYVVEGDPKSGLLKGINENNHELLGRQEEGDHRIQAYNFRICLTKEKENQVPIPKPPKYDPEEFELLLRYIQSGIWDAMNLHRETANGKTDLNNFGAVSTDYIGMNYDWPEGSYERREEIFQDHLNYNLGMLYFLGNDERVPPSIRKEVLEWGLPKDEFTETGHWPHMLYIREGRRMISDYVMTDKNCLRQEFVEDPIGMASYQMDSHHCRRVVINGRCVNEGDVQISTPPYSISYRAIRPKVEECANLLVPVCLSSSHIAYGSIRMEPVFMILGQSAAIAAVLAIKQNVNIQDVNYKELKQELINAGQVLELKI